MKKEDNIENLNCQISTKINNEIDSMHEEYINENNEECNENHEQRKEILKKLNNLINKNVISKSEDNQTLLSKIRNILTQNPSLNLDKQNYEELNNTESHYLISELSKSGIHLLEFKKILEMSEKKPKNVTTLSL